MTDTAAEWVPVTELRVNDLVDLEGDRYADPGHGEPGHDCVHSYDNIVVGGEDGPGEREDDNCYRLDTWYASYGFPPAHKVRRVGVFEATLPDAPINTTATTPIGDAVTGAAPSTDRR